MKRCFVLFLCLVMLLSFGACSSPQPPVETTEETKQVDNFPYPTIHDKLTWEKINAQPSKRPDMTIQEMREACVQFMRFSKTVLWTPNAYMSFIRNSKGVQDELQKGIVYAGLPYVGLGCGNVYRMMDYIDEETGVMDMEYPSAYPKLFGNQCSNTAYWAWSRIISSVEHAYTSEITHRNGYLRIGPYTYDDSQFKYSPQYTTTMICGDNGLSTMCESYAQLHLADGLVQYLGEAGHVIMVSSEPHIEYAGGRIDPANSYITILEQSQAWTEYTGEMGDTAQVKVSIDKKVSFSKLFDDSYIPFTFAEFLGTKGIAETQCSINLSGERVEPAQLFSARVQSNFGISDIYVSLKNADGKEVYKLAVRATSAGVKELRVQQNASNAFTWGDYETLSGEYAVEVSAQLSTGERPVLYSGKTTLS